MFERAITESGFEKATQSSDMRLLEWSTLCARLSASRDLRQMVSNQGCDTAGNFASFSSEAAGKLNGKSACVNPDDLGEPKNTGSNMPDTANGAATGDREF